MPAQFDVARRLGAALLALPLLAALAGPTAAQIIDADGDGLYDADEALYGGDPNNPDTDYDMLQDGFEVYEFGSSPALFDTDGDKLTDYGEWVYRTAPRNPDTDGDGVGDGDEYAAGTDPNVPDAAHAPGSDRAERPDADGDGLFDDDESEVYGTDPAIVDTDGDGSGDGEEVYLGADPRDADDAP